MWVWYATQHIHTHDYSNYGVYNGMLELHSLQESSEPDTDNVMNMHIKKCFQLGQFEVILCIDNAELTANKKWVASTSWLYELTSLFQIQNAL